MPFMMCPKGHLYNADMYDTCNICAQDEGGVEKTMLLSDPVPETPIGGGGGPTGTILNVAEPSGPRHGLDLSGGGFAGGQPERTIVQLSAANPELRSAPSEGEVLPVVGWLVIVTGPGVGRDFRLIPGQNYIGRDKDMEVCLDLGADSDPMVSRREHALVVYDTQANECYISDRSESRNLPRLNGKTVRSPAVLASGDIIQVGETRFLFQPLCGDAFNWGNVPVEP